jgi:hypothetical protein
MQSAWKPDSKHRYALKAVEKAEMEKRLRVAQSENDDLREQLRQLQLAASTFSSSPLSVVSAPVKKAAAAPDSSSSTALSSLSSSSLSGARELVERIRREKGLHFAAGSDERLVVDRLLRWFSLGFLQLFTP